MWQSFLALHPWGWVTTGAILLVGFIKRKAIGAGTTAVWKKFDAWFWEKMRTKLQLQPQASQAGQTQLRTYTGTFQDYVYKSAPYASHTLTMSSNGFQVSVPVNDTHLFLGIKRGTFIEVDTEVRMSCELVRRVRKGETT